MVKNSITSKSLTLYEFVRLPLKLYSLCGIKLFKWTEDDVVTMREKVTLAVLTINILENFFAKSLYFIFDQFHSTVHMTQWFLYFIFANNGIFKMISVLLGRKKLHGALQKLDRLFPQSAGERRDFRLQEGYTEMRGHCNIMANTHWAIAAMFIMFPFVQSVIEYWRSPDESQMFVGHTPYIMTYPFDTTRGIAYVYAYATQLLGGVTVSAYFIASDMLLLCTVYMLILQYEYLCLRISNFKSTEVTQDMSSLKEFLETHCLLNDLAQSLNEVFSLSILLNYMISIIVMVLIGIQITTSTSELFDIVKFVGFLTATTFQIYYICLYGTKLLEASSKVSEKFFGQEWFMTNVRYQRMIVMAIARSQRPSHLTAFKFFVISMESFANMIKTSYQFFTLLKARMEEHL